jgi:hypothetical protein
MPRHLREPQSFPEIPDFRNFLRHINYCNVCKFSQRLLFVLLCSMSRWTVAYLENLNTQVFNYFNSCITFQYCSTLQLISRFLIVWHIIEILSGIWLGFVQIAGWKSLPKMFYFVQTCFFLCLVSEIQICASNKRKRVLFLFSFRFNLFDHKIWFYGLKFAEVEQIQLSAKYFLSIPRHVNPKTVKRT